MTNEEAVKELESAYSDDIFRHGEYEACIIAINSIQENAKLKAEIEQWQSTNLKLVCELTRLECENYQLKSELEQSVKLPYLVGTPLYFAFSKQGIVKDKIRRWHISEHGIVFYSKGSSYPVEFIGKYAFLSREEAEQSLKGANND